MLCFRKFPVAKKFMDKKGGAECQDFPSKFFCVTLPKNFVGELLLCHYFRLSKNLMLQMVMSLFSVDIFLSHSTETFRRGTVLCCISVNSW